MEALQGAGAGVWWVNYAAAGLFGGLLFTAIALRRAKFMATLVCALVGLVGGLAFGIWQSPASWYPDYPTIVCAGFVVPAFAGFVSALAALVLLTVVGYNPENYY
jgi:hypothetical protein